MRRFEPFSETNLDDKPQKWRIWINISAISCIFFEERFPSKTLNFFSQDIQRYLIFVLKYIASPFFEMQLILIFSLLWINDKDLDGNNYFPCESYTWLNQFFYIINTFLLSRKISCLVDVHAWPMPKTFQFWSPLFFTDIYN